jgi:glycosyltransferase involved in cell wall biosynthesis
VLVIASDGFGGHGGIALYACNVLRGLSTYRKKPYVVALPRVMPFAPDALPENLDWDISGLGGKGRYARAVLRAAFRGGRFDLVLCLHVHLLSLAYPVARLQGAPIVLFAYGIEVKQPTGKPLANRFVSMVDAVVSIRRHTTRALRSWADLDDAPDYLLENAIDLARYGVAPKEPSLVERFGLGGKHVVMTLSRMGEQYIGVDEVLGALRHVVREVPSVVYLVGGDGPDLPRLRDKAKALGVAQHVVFAGFVPDEQKADYYRLADVYAMPGSGPDFDRYPLRFAFLEAMACGVPVIGAMCEDDDERKVDGALLARQVDPHEPEAIARAVIDGLGMPRVIPPGLGRFGYPSFERRLHVILDEVVTRGKRGGDGTRPPSRSPQVDQPQENDSR